MKIVIVEAVKEQSIDIPEETMELLRLLVLSGRYIQVIKYIRNISNIGLREAKNIVDNEFVEEKEEYRRIQSQRDSYSVAAHILNMMEKEWNIRGEKLPMNIHSYLITWRQAKERKA